MSGILSNDSLARDIDVLSETKAECLRRAGFRSLDDIEDATLDELSDVRGIGTPLAYEIVVDTPTPEPFQGGI